MRKLLLAFCLLVAVATAGFAQSTMMGMGDSLGEGVQSYNAWYETQANGYLSYIAKQAGASFRLPLIKSDSKGIAGVANRHRQRIDATSIPSNLAVNGAKVTDVLGDVAGTNPRREVDLVLPPYYGLSQIEIVEQVKPKLVYLWIGNNDVIDYVLDWKHLNQPHGTPISTFTNQYYQLITRLKNAGVAAVLGNIPDVTKIAFLVDNDTLTSYTGTNYNLPVGYYTTLPTLISLKLGNLDASVLQDPNYVLSPDRLAFIRTQIQMYNDVITNAAASAGYAIADTADIFNQFAESPVVIGDVVLTNKFNGGAFSLDGVHPSNVGYATLAKAFIQAANFKFDTGIPQITLDQMIDIVNVDPFVDRNGNGVVAGRPNTGLLESLYVELGFSGDTNDLNVSAPIAAPKKADPNAFMRIYFAGIGKNPNTPWTRADLSDALDVIFGVRH